MLNLLKNRIIMKNLIIIQKTCHKIMKNSIVCLIQKLKI